MDNAIQPKPMLKFLQFPQPLDQAELLPLTEQILVLSKALTCVPVPATIKQKLFHQQLLKSSLFSAKIEGNQLTLIQAKQADLRQPKEKSKLEVSNVMKALAKIKTFSAQLSIANLSTLHQLIMVGLDDQAGKLRCQASAIFDGFGNVVYLTPEPAAMQQMLTVMLTKINQLQADQPASLASYAQRLDLLARCHYYFEKIHPFVDGNGRTGRALLHYQLWQTGLFPDFYLPIDEYFEKYRHDYYNFLEKSTRHIDQLIKFILEGIIWSLESILAEIKAWPMDDLASTDQQTWEDAQQNLLPRRQEIINILNDHPYLSLANLARRFPNVPKRTLAYDLNHLVKKALVIKHGETRGVLYTVKKS